MERENYVNDLSKQLEWKPLRVASCWSVIPIVLKPDALEGDATLVQGALAADFAALLSIALDGQSSDNFEPLVSSSTEGEERARKHAQGEMDAIWWYTREILDAPRCKQRLQRLQAKWGNVRVLPVAEVIADACVAVGFDIVSSVDRILSLCEYMQMYRDTTKPAMHEKMTQFMVGKRVRHILLCGKQQNSALQLLKTYMRYVMRYPTTKPQIENWLHVTNPDASNYSELLRICVASDR